MMSAFWVKHEMSFASKLHGEAQLVEVTLLSCLRACIFQKSEVLVTTAGDVHINQESVILQLHLFQSCARKSEASGTFCLLA